MVKTRKSETRLIAAECARRTGLTVRALRLYERDGLIRLNIVVALKNFGLSLKQVRVAFDESTPALTRVLDMQLEVWASRRLAADHAIGLTAPRTGVRPAERRAFRPPASERS